MMSRCRCEEDGVVLLLVRGRFVSAFRVVSSKIWLWIGCVVSYGSCLGRKRRFRMWSSGC